MATTNFEEKDYHNIDPWITTGVLTVLLSYLQLPLLLVLLHAYDTVHTRTSSPVDILWGDL